MLENRAKPDPVKTAVCAIDASRSNSAVKQTVAKTGLENVKGCIPCHILAFSVSNILCRSERRVGNRQRVCRGVRLKEKVEHIRECYEAFTSHNFSAIFMLGIFLFGFGFFSAAAYVTSEFALGYNCPKTCTHKKNYKLKLMGVICCKRQDN